MTRISLQRVGSALRSPRPLSTAIGLTFGFVLGLAWFLLLVEFPMEYRVRGDALGYLRIAFGFPSLADALAYVGERSVGFPLTLYALKESYLLFFPTGTAAGLVNFITAVLFCIHVSSSLLFFFTARKYASSRGVDLHWALGAILLAYPGIVAHTTVPLTETFCADLVMAGFAAALWGSGASGWRTWVGGILGGCFLGFAVLCRPSFEPAAALAVVLWPLAALTLPLPPLAGWAQTMRSRLVLPNFRAAIAFAVGFAACIVPAEWHCSERFGSRCLIEAQRYQREILSSVRIGTYSPRAYWSRHAGDGDGCGSGCRALRDETLAATWAVSCQPTADAVGYGLPGCFVRRPDLGALFLGKKMLALFDSYHFQPYTVDMTPRWARLWSRPFGAAAYAGFMLAFVLLVLALRDRSWRELVPLLAFTLAFGLVHSLTHTEGRYGYGAVPGALLSLFWLLGSSGMQPGRRRVVYAAAILLAVAFLVQTSLWDRADIVLQRIESSLE